MGTKIDPGKFDCYNSAAPDEPIFVLLGRDPHAAVLVRIWALLRHRTGDETDDEKIKEALRSADALEIYARSKDKRVECGSVVTNLLEAATVGLNDHPDDYEHACECDTCGSYD